MTSESKKDRRIIYSCGYEGNPRTKFKPDLGNAEPILYGSKYTPAKMISEIKFKEKKLKQQGWDYVKIEWHYDGSEDWLVIYGWKYETEEDLAERKKKEEVRVRNTKLNKIAELEDRLAKLKSEVNQCDGCARGLPLKHGVHKGDGGIWDSIACTKHLYEE